MKVLADPRLLLAAWAVDFSKRPAALRESLTASRLRDEDCLDPGAGDETWVETGDLVVWGA